jgi:hypothetical protein
MAHTYKAILRGNQLEWASSAPQLIDATRALAVEVIIADELPVQQNGSQQAKRMLAPLEQLAKDNLLAEIVDPLAWEREQRQERILPDRET